VPTLKYPKRTCIHMMLAMVEIREGSGATDLGVFTGAGSRRLVQNSDAEKRYLENFTAQQNFHVCCYKHTARRLNTHITTPRCVDHVCCYVAEGQERRFGQRSAYTRGCTVSAGRHPVTHGYRRIKGITYSVGVKSTVVACGSRQCSRQCVCRLLRQKLLSQPGEQGKD
jgi:hypothetical protein